MMKFDYVFPALPAAVLFDLDGTLVDSAPDLVEAVNHLRLAQGLERMPFELLRPYASHGAAGLVQAGLGIGSGEPQFNHLKQLFLDYYQSHVCVFTSAFEGVEQVLTYFERSGIPWGIITNKHERFAQPLISALGWAERAAVLVYGDTTPHAKPHPEPMMYAAEALRLSADSLAYVGDDHRDIQAARASGYMSAIAAAYGYGQRAEIPDWQADAVLEQPNDLLRLFEL